jgi:ureidoacrylate peracid hydrolase
MSDELDPKRTALLTIDLQNDFLHPEGAYGRAGQGSEAIAALPARIRPSPMRSARRAAPISARSSRWCPARAASR